VLSAGAKDFQNRFALFHGDNGKGNGPYSFALVFKPADLTQLLIENDGTFPFMKTYLIIDGREVVKAHGSRLMPIWGDRYAIESKSELDSEFNATHVRGKIFELLLFLFSIQETPPSE